MGIPHGTWLDDHGICELKERVYDHMLRTRGAKYQSWVRGIKRCRTWARLAEQYLAPLGVRYFKNASLRIELIEAIYSAMRLADDIVDTDAPLPSPYASSSAYVESLIRFVEAESTPSTDVERLLSYAFSLGDSLAMDMRPAVRDMLGSLLFDARRQESRTLQIFDRETLEHHFHLLDIRGTIGGCLVVSQEPAEAWTALSPLGEATRIRYNLRDLAEDLRANLCNIAREDVERLGISDVRNAACREILEWKRLEAERGLSLLDTYRQHAPQAKLHVFTRAILFLVYEWPTARYLKRLVNDLTRATTQVTMESSMPPVDKIAWMPIRDRKVLFARSRGQTLFYTVGGKREPGETDEEALRREVREETGAEIKPDSIRHLHTFSGPAHGRPEGTMLKLACYQAEATSEPQASAEVEELDWLTSADMERTTETGRMVLGWLVEQDLID